MLTDFFYTLRNAHLPVSVSEYLTLLKALQEGVVGPLRNNSLGTEGTDNAHQGYSIDDFYFLSRMSLIKDERHYDKFDRAFASYFKGVQFVSELMSTVPLDWVKKVLEKEFSPEQLAAIQKMGWDELMQTLKKRLQEQKERHEGGSKWIGTGGTSPFGNAGANPQGVRIGGQSQNKSAVKV